MNYIFNLYTLFTILFISFHVGYPLNQLSFSGGGSFGAVEIGILKYLMHHNPKQFNLYTGISAGALNAGVLSYYSNINEGIKKAEDIYSSINTRMIYKPFPLTGRSLVNTKPLFNTLSSIIETMPNQPIIPTLIGATNLYSGKMDVYSFEEQNDIDKVSLLMSSSAIPCMFPPVDFNHQLYADGSTLSNELIQVAHDSNYLNITFITPYDDLEYDYTPIMTLKDMLCRTIKIIINNYNNPIACINENCKIPIGEINKYYVPSKVLRGYHILNFDKCEKLIQIGYENVLHKKYDIC